MKTLREMMDIVEAAQQPVAEMDNRTSSDDRKEQRRNSPEERARQDKEQQSRLKSMSPEMRKKLRLPEPKEDVAEDQIEEASPEAMTKVERLYRS